MFGWLKKRKRGSARPPRRLPRRVLAPVEEITEQGLLVADVAVRMTVKNAIIMNALKRHVDYDAEQIIDMVRETTIDLAEERERDAKHISRMRGEIRDTGRSSWSESDYGNDDNRTLRHRQEVYEKVAEELRNRAADDEYLNAAAERAREMAWDEIGTSLADRAEHPYYSGGNNDEYREEREGRIQQLIEKDLTALMQQQTQPPTKVRKFKRKDKGREAAESEL
ncbi:asparagine synthase [Leucobacter sp. USCH14]|uniref:asparagine synthase n=1 Tax=Leucobacter sp. USCH14 TaxID=3024838 RepID=UPI0030A9879F